MVRLEGRNFILGPSVNTVALERRHLDTVRGVVRPETFGNSKSLVIPIYPSLQAVLDATPCGNMTFLRMTSPRRCAVSNSSANAWADSMFKTAQFMSARTRPTKRKATARRLADEGATTHQIAAITGHKSLSEVQRYTRSADQARMAREAVALRTQRGQRSGKPSA